MNSIQEEFGVQDVDGTTTYVLGHPLTPRLDKHRYSYGEDEEFADEFDDTNKRADQGLDATWTTYPSPQPSSMSSSTPTLSQPPSMSSMGETSSIASSSRRIHPALSVTPLINPSDHTSSRLSHRSSNSSVRSAGSPVSAATVVPPKTLRSRVSMDVIQPKPISMASSIRSSRSVSSLADNRDVPWTYHPQSSITRRSFDGGHTDPEAEPDAAEREDEEPDEVPTMRPLADAALRSAPGVIGLGEGWAGGPQRSDSARRKWWTRKKVQDGGKEDDPLSLWAINESREDVGGDTPRSPMRNLWNRSRSAFGGSMPALSSIGSPKDSRVRKPVRKTQKVSTAEQSPTPDKTQAKRRSLVALFSKSQTTIISATRSTPHLARTPTASTATPPQSLSSTHKTSSEANRSEPSLPSSLPPTARISTGPRPPWRPTSYVASSSSHTPAVRFYDLPATALSETSLAAVMSPSSGVDKALPPIPVEARPNTLRRTSTFGAIDIAAEQGLAVGTELPANVHGDSDSTERHSTVGFDTIAAWAEEPKKKTVIDQGGPSILSKIRTALAPSPSRSTTPSPMIRRSTAPSPLKRFSLATTEHFSRPPLATSSSTPIIVPIRRESDPAYQTTQAAIQEALETPRRPQTSMSTKHTRRSSWKSGSETWMRRLSRLTELDEDGLSTNDDSPDSPRSSFFDRVRVLPTRSYSLMPMRNARSRSRMSSSSSAPALTRLTTTQLDLRLDLPDDGLELDDILDNSRRRTIIDTFDLEHCSPFPDPPNRSPTIQPVGRRSSSRSRRSHVRGVSEPHQPTGESSKEPSGHSRNVSEPIDGVPSLVESNSNITTSESGGSSTFPETPHMPSVPPLTKMNPYVNQTEATRPSFNPLRSEVSFYSAQEAMSDDGLELVKAESRLSDLSDEAVVGQAVKVASVGDMQRKASVLTMDDLRLYSPSMGHSASAGSHAEWTK